MEIQTSGARDEGRAFIEEIRRSEYMIGMTLAPEAEAAAEGMRRKLSSALRLLSEDLYSTKTHFVLELVQNADDNTYAVETDPEIHLSLLPGALTIWNNERGFTPENVRALCSVGESTKSKKEGFIGEKGIGFKSVFQVSSTPEVHSNGFHFRFDMSDTQAHLGYVVPHWIEPDSSIAAQGTTIVLPAKAQAPFSDAVLSELDAHLLLFLRKLRRIDLRTPGKQMSMRRLDDDGLIDLQTDSRGPGADEVSSRERYLRVSASVSMAGAPDEKRPAILDSEVVLAFPVDEAGKALASPNCATFAFLPIRAFGFRFCVQADFLLNSAREDIQSARAWNTSLRDAIVPTFIANLDQFRSRPALARTFLQYLPQEGELTHGFFAPVVQQLQTALAQTECILCATGQWRRPDQVISAPVAFQRLVAAEQAWTLFGKDYPARDLAVDPATLKKLGCGSLLVADLVKLFTEHGEWILKQGRPWLVRCFRYLSTINRQHLVEAGIQKAACLPISDGSLRSASERTVFYPLARSKKFGFEEELLLLDEAFLDAIGDQDDPDIRSLLHDLGVRTPEPYSLIADHILPAHKGERWRDSAFTALTGHVRYIKAKLADYLSAAATRGLSEASAMEALRKGLRLKTKKNEGNSWWFKHPEEVYLGIEYEPEFDIETLVTADLDPLRVASADYLPANLAKVDPQNRSATLLEWRQFFLRLGVSPSPLLATDGTSSCSPELKALLESDVAAVRRQTLECLDRHWDRYSRQVTYSPSGRPLVKYFTSFATTLRATIAPTRQRRSVAVQESYYPTEVVRDVFGTSATYIDAELHSEGFLDTCGIVHRVDASACIKRLKQIKSGDRPSTAHVRQLYKHLDQIFDRNAESVREAFEEHALILTRSVTAPWRRPDQVVWSSPGDFLSIHYPALQGQYGDSHGFFVRKLGVPHEVSIAAAVRALPSLTTAELSAEARAGEALRIYARASRDIASPSSSIAPTWLADFENRPVFLNHRGQMVSVDDALFADDQPATSALFLEREEISFLAVPSARLPTIRALLDAAGVRMLSDSLEITLQDPGAGRPNTMLTTRVRERYRYMARLVYAQSHTVFERAKQAGLWRRLSLLRVLDVDDLTICTTLQGISATTQGEVVVSTDSAFVRVGARGVADRLAREICLMLKAPLTLVDGISRILRDTEAAEIEEYLDVREIPALPDDEISQLTIEAASPPSESSGEADAVVDPEAIDPAHAPAPSGEEQDPASVVETHPGRLPTLPTGSTSADSRARPPLPPSPAPTYTAPPTGGSVPIVSGGDTLARLPADAPLESSNPSGGSGGARGASTSSGRVGSHRRNARRRPPRHTPDRHDPGHRLLSYVQQKTENDDLGVNEDGSDRARDRDATAQAAVRYFLRTQRDKWASLEEMPPYNKGFDVRGVAHDGSEHFIEVKGQSAAWTAAGIAMTPSEVLCAADNRERYWLCIVEHATQEGQQVLHLVNNPFGQADQFRFDSGWKAVAVSEMGPPPLTPAPGLRIDIEGLGSGTVFSVKRTGSMFCKVHVYLADGRQVFRVFDPARMRLSKGD